jgi:hypothetical protein
MKLHSQTIPLHLLTPCWLSGEDQLAPDWRVASLRGQLRWWLRALAPGQRHDVSLLGGDHAAGMMSSCIRIESSPLAGAEAEQHDLTSYRSTHPQSDETYFMWPIGNNRRRGAWMPRTEGSGFDLKWSCLRPFSLTEEWNRCLRVFALLGSLSGRSSRGYGSIWPRSNAPTDTDALIGQLNQLTLPGHIRIRLLEGAHDHPRQALAAAALWLKSFRAGSNRSGICPSKEGLEDHDLGLRIIARMAPPNVQVHRPVLGLPLKQSYYERRGSVTTKFNLSDRYPSPVRIKIIRLGDEYRVLFILLDHDDYRLPLGSHVTLNGNHATITHDILTKMLASGAIILH